MATVSLPDALRRRMVEHCIAALPNEGCGLLAMDGNTVVMVYPTGNEDASPVRYTIPPQEHFSALLDAENRGWRLGGAFHSHPTGPARMSTTDLDRALDGDWLYVVLGLEGGVEWGGWRDGAEVSLAD